MEMLERVGGLLEVSDREDGIETGASLRSEHGLEIRAVDPVHRDDVPVVDEEVLAHEWQSRMRRQREEHPRLGEKPTSRCVVFRRSDLQCDVAPVEVVEGPDHLRLAARSGDLEALVPVAEELGLHGVSRPCAGRRA